MTDRLFTLFTLVGFCKLWFTWKGTVSFLIKKQNNEDFSATFVKIQMKELNYDKYEQSLLKLQENVFFTFQFSIKSHHEIQLKKYIFLMLICFFKNYYSTLRS